MAKDITIKRYSGTSWEPMYPKTTAKNILTGGASYGMITSTMIESVDTTQVTGLITDGKISETLLPALAITNVLTESYSSLEEFYTFYNGKSIDGRQEYAQEGDVVILLGANITLIKVSNSGLAGDAVFRELKTPADAAVGVLSGRVGTLETKVGTAETNIASNTSDIANLQSASTTLSSTVDSLETRVEVAEGNISTIRLDVNANKAKITNLDAVTAGKVNKIDIEAQTSEKLRKFAYNAQGQVTSSTDYVYAWGDFPILEGEVEARMAHISLVDSSSALYPQLVENVSKIMGNIYFEY